MNLLRTFNLVTLIFLSTSLSIFAEDAATLVNLVGKARVIKADKKVIELKVKDKVEEGDTIVTDKDTFAMFKFTDNAETILRPETEWKINGYKFVTDDPSKDNSNATLVKGGLRRLSGLCGKRGNPEADKLITATATVGIRGTIYDALSCSGGGGCEKLKNGNYFKVKDGQISVKNEAGEILISKGQFGYVASPNSKPEVLPKDPGFPRFNPSKDMQPDVKSGSQCAA